ncbi:MAG: hypothetical protein KGI60_00585 [Patescibacteria group bacterium]|nr:hypothetical protein [Patescibacteria group bacterium]
MKRLTLAAVAGCMLFSCKPAFSATCGADGVGAVSSYVDVYARLDAPQSKIARYSAKKASAIKRLSPDQKMLADSLVAATWNELSRRRMLYFFTMKMAYIRSADGSPAKLESALAVHIPDRYKIRIVPLSQTVTESRWHSKAWMAKHAAKLLVDDLVNKVQELQTETAQR